MPEVTAADRARAVQIVAYVLDYSEGEVDLAPILAMLAAVRAEGEMAGAAHRDVLMDQAEHIARERDILRARVTTLDVGVQLIGKYTKARHAPSGPLTVEQHLFDLLSRIERTALDMDDRRA
jgi:hypothetical protein